MLYLAMLAVLFVASDAWSAGAPVRIDGGDSISVVTDIPIGTSATLLAVGNKNRVALNCSTSGDVRWGSSLVTSTRGQLVPAGASIEIRNTSAIYMISLSGVSILSCTEEIMASSSSGGIFSP